MSSAKLTRLTDAQRLDWLRLIRSENIGPRTFAALIERYGSAARALAVLPDLARRGGAARSIRIPNRAEVERELDAMARLGACLIGWSEPDYPQALAATDYAPPLIAAVGDITVLQRPMVAIVGSRNASAVGIAMTERLARGLAQAGLVVVSGLARGIDARAHQATLASGTVAVLSGGLDRVYPPEHAPLLNSILEHGAAITEMPIGWEPRGRDFPRRNRIVAGLSLGTIVVEAARRSGSLITARFANEQGREVFAVPGSPLDPRAEGTNDLLKQGATFCTRPEEIIDVLQPLITKGLPNKPAGIFHARHVMSDLPLEDLIGRAAEADLSASSITEADESSEAEANEPPDEIADVSRRVAALLGPSPIGIDDIARAAGASIRDVHLAVLELELAGRLARHGSNLVSLRPEA